MDIATVIGLIGAFALIFMAIDNIEMFINTPSLIIVVGGSIAVVLMRSTLAEFLGAVGVAMKVFLVKIDKPADIVNQMVELATIARKDGLIALEGQEISNKFLAKGIGMLVDGTDVDKIKKALKTENQMMKDRHAGGAEIFVSWGAIAPAMGMIGTLIGLVQMLAAMDDPKAIGPAMAIALLTTMYGAILANVVCIPIAEKLNTYSKAEAANNELVTEGVLFIQSGGNPRVMGDLLAAFVPPKQRAAISTA